MEPAASTQSLIYFLWFAVSSDVLGYVNLSINVERKKMKTKESDN